MRRIMLASCLFSPIALAGPIADGFGKAMQNDPLFLSASPERDAAEYAAYSGMAQYAPEFRATYDQLETESLPRTTYSITQPIFDGARIASFLEGEPRRKLAATTYVTREQELAQRYFKAVSESIKAVENIRLNEARIIAFEQQFKSAKRTFEAGVGTITDVRDAEVRLEQARASHVAMIAQRNNVFRQLALLLGEMPAESLLVLPQDVPNVPLPDPQLVKQLAVTNSVQMDAARQNQRLAELNAMRAKGILLPNVSVTYTDSEINNSRSKFTGVVVNIPIGLSNTLQASSASASALKQRYQTEDTENRVRLEAERLRETVEAGVVELSMRLAAIRAAELSVDSNEKSYKGGIKSTADVLNAIQILFQTRQEYVNSKLVLAENWLNLKMQTAVSAEEAVKEVELLLRGSN